MQVTVLQILKKLIEGARITLTQVQFVLDTLIMTFPTHPDVACRTVYYSTLISLVDLKSRFVWHQGIGVYD